jgi:hypothetical protein
MIVTRRRIEAARDATVARWGEVTLFQIDGELQLTSKFDLNLPPRDQHTLLHSVPLDTPLARACVEHEGEWRCHTRNGEERRVDWVVFVVVVFYGPETEGV